MVRKGFLLALFLVLISPIFGIYLADIVGYHEPLDLVGERLGLQDRTEDMNWTPFLGYSVPGLPGWAGYIISGLIGILVILGLGVLMIKLRVNSLRRSLAERVLQNFSNTFNEMMVGHVTLSVEPWAIMLSSFFFTVAMSFSKGLLAPVVGMALLTIIAFRFRLFTLFKIVVIAAGFALLIIAPMAILAKFDVFNLASLVLRTSTASGSLALGFMLIGQKGLKRALLSLGFRPSWVFSIILFLRFLPVMVRLTTKSLIAREARIVGEKGRWLILSSVVGDIILKGYERAWRLRLAMEARGTFLYERSKPKIGMKELVLTLGSLATLVLML